MSRSSAASDRPFTSMRSIVRVGSIALARNYPRITTKVRGTRVLQRTNRLAATGSALAGELLTRIWCDAIPCRGNLRCRLEYRLFGVPDASFA
jgi:hypothetical protein